ncbi:MAG: peptidoglycan DD-metalloendopeptidase family protein [Candidatus Helarchaeota archaeon]
MSSRGKSKIIFIIIQLVILIFVLVGCANTETHSPTLTPTNQPTPTSTKEPTTTPTPSPTPTNTPKPTYTLSGTIFFDYNGSGLQDVAYDMNGEAVNEPGIPDGPVCIDHNPYELGIDGENCTYSNANGFYTFSDLEDGSHVVYIVSPSDEPAEAFRYINVWKGPVVVDEYTKDIDAGTMQTLEAIQPCDEYSEVLVCKYDEDTLLVREQHLNNTEVKSIDNPLAIRVNGDIEKNISLMQGFLNWHIVGNELCEPYISTFFDHDTNSGSTLDWRENTILDYCLPSSGPINGICDDHIGTDIIAKKGTYVYASLPGSVNFAEKIGECKHVTLDHMNRIYQTGYGHLETILVTFDQRIYSGQIIGLVGNTGTFGDHLHFNFHDNTQIIDGVPKNVDPFGSPYNDYSFFWIIAPKEEDYPITHN